MKILGFYITRTDWRMESHSQAGIVERFRKKILEQEEVIYRLHNKNKETFTGKDGRLRFKINGQFAPDNRSKSKRVHDQLRCELNNAIKKEGFGR